MQFLARAEPMLGCERQLVVPLATEAWLLEALNSRPPPALEPLASWRQTGKVELPDVEERRQHFWSARLIQVKAASLLEAANGRDVPRLEAQGWLLAPPVAGQGLCLAGANYSTLLKWHLEVPLLPVDCVARSCNLCGEPLDIFGDHAVSCKKSGFGDKHLGPQCFFCQVLTISRIPQDREVNVASNSRSPAEILLKVWDGRRNLTGSLTTVHLNTATGRPLRGSAATFLRNKGNKRIGRALTRADGWLWTCSRWCSTPKEASMGPGRKWQRRSSQDAQPPSFPLPMP